MRALTVFIDEQWLAAVSEKDMSVPSHIIAKDMTEQLPLEVQYLGVTKTTFIYDENVLDEEKAVYYLRQILQNRFEMDYDVQEAIINYRISALSDEDEEDDESEQNEPESGGAHKRKSSGKESHTEKLTGFEEGGSKESGHEQAKGASSRKRMRTAPDTSTKEDSEDSDDTEIVTVGEEGAGTLGKPSKKGKDQDNVKSKKPEKKLGQDPISFGNKKEDGDIAPAFQRIKNLKGSDSLISLCERLNRIAPALQTEEFIDVLEDRAYLFSAEQDIGINARVSMFFDFMRDENLLPSEYGGCEIQLACGRSIGLPTTMAKQFIVQTEASMYCIDISAWVGQIDDPEFRDFLLFLYGQKDMYRYVFRIPYVEKKILNQVADVIGDIFTVEVVTLPPLNQKLLEETAVSQLEDYGYSISPEALTIFRKRIAEEKSDGRFYGMNTIGKIVKEMVLKKLEQSITEEEKDKPDAKNEKKKSSKASENKKPTEEKSLTEITGKDIGDLIVKHHDTSTPEQELVDMIGTEEVREQLNILIKEMSETKQPLNIRFVGNPGTGRTVVARLLGDILREKGILKKGEIIEHSMKDLMGTVPGETVPKTLSICRDALDSILFIDEPYPEIKEMVGDLDEESEDFDDTDEDNDKPEYNFHKEALETLISEMEANRNLVVILALTFEELEKVRKDVPDIDKVMYSEIEFKDFSRKELGDIFLRMVRRNKFSLEEGLREEILKYFDKLPEKVTKSGKFTNARYVRNLFDMTWSKTLLRAEIDQNDGRLITRQDFRLAASESAEILNKKEPRKYPLGFRLETDD
ncbi:AAA family ATPase [Oribacterium sp. FC2011]|uniref:AAA family ATPase n=1 Tax=Oribacterium sp. FC2011 TaxID=1408311 RepID=UPI0004E219C2|nr:AAA family ATPase [Oribacterium sp. FC2011]